MTVHIDFASPVLLAVLVFISISWGASYKFYDLILGGMFDMFRLFIDVFGGGRETYRGPSFNRSETLTRCALATVGCALAFVLNSAAHPYWAIACGISAGWLLGSSVAKYLLLSPKPR